MEFRISAVMFTLWFGYFGLCSTATGQVGSERHNETAKRPVTVADAIEMTQIGDRSYLENLSKRGNVVQFSPDGTKLAFVTQKADLKTDLVEFQLLVFKTAEAFDSPAPNVVATMASSSNREGIRQVQWLADNDTIVFLGEQPAQSPQLYKVSVSTKKLQRLTNQPTLILDYAISEKGDNFVYVAEALPLPAISKEMRSRGFVVTNQEWDELYTDRRSLDTRREIYVKTPETKSPQRAGPVLDMRPDWMALSISPNALYALVRAYRTSPPLIWNDYQYRDDVEFQPTSITACNAGETFRCPEQFYVVDLNRRTVDPLLNVPLVRKNPLGFGLAAWTRQSSILLINTLLPLDSVQGEERGRRLTHVYAIEVTVPARKILKISERLKPYSAFFIESDPAKDRILFSTGITALGPPLEFRRQGNGWRISEAAGAESELDGRFSVTLDQDINTPPKLVAHDPKTKRKAVVLDPNPQFSRLTFGHVEIFRWKTSKGDPGEGTLYYPPDYVAGNKYPLIIQTHDERRDRFWIDGPYSTGYAAQPLANRGFVVLQMGMVDIYEKASVDEVYKYMSTAEEGPYYMALFESAIDELSRRGLIDPTRVGISGFSRTVYHVLYALTHSRYAFAAAVAADGSNFGYVQCLYYRVKANGSLCQNMNGGALPFSDGLSVWAQTAPAFRLDKVKAPLLLQTITSPFEEWAIFAGLQWLKKPVEMLNFYPEGEHILVRPQQRLLSQGSVVDWYCYWLKGESDPDPKKTEQYARWRKMREENGSGRPLSGS